MISQTAPKGQYNRILAMDCETSGIFFAANPARQGDDRYQCVSWGFQVLDTEFTALDELYVEIQWDGESLWSNKAESVHGLSKEYLAHAGMIHESAYELILNFIFKWFGNTSIVPLGHNVGFDVMFLREEALRYGIELSFGNRVLDSNTLGLTLFRTYTSDQLFEQMGQKGRVAHNALDDIKRTVQVFRVARAIADRVLEAQQ